MNKLLKQKLKNWHSSSEYKERKGTENELKPILKSFQKRFNPRYINKMNIDSYVEGKRKTDTFCYCVEKTFVKFGRLSGITRAFQKFVIYWDKKRRNTLLVAKMLNKERDLEAIKTKSLKTLEKS